MKYSLLTTLALAVGLSACGESETANVASEAAEKVEAAVEAMTKV